jgi:hypothetical protein
MHTSCSDLLVLPHCAFVSVILGSEVRARRASEGDSVLFLNLMHRPGEKAWSQEPELVGSLPTKTETSLEIISLDILIGLTHGEARAHHHTRLQKMRQVFCLDKWGSTLSSEERFSFFPRLDWLNQFPRFFFEQKRADSKDQSHNFEESRNDLVMGMWGWSMKRERLPEAYPLYTQEPDGTALW